MLPLRIKIDAFSPLKSTPGSVVLSKVRLLVGFENEFIYLHLLT